MSDRHNVTRHIRQSRYYVAAEFGAPKPYQVIERDTNTVIDEFVLERDAEKRAASLNKRRQNAPKVPVAKLISSDSTTAIVSVGRETVTVTAKKSPFDSPSYDCTCSGSAGQLGCKHIDAAKKALTSGE